MRGCGTGSDATTAKSASLGLAAIQPEPSAVLPSGWPWPRRIGGPRRPRPKPTSLIADGSQTQHVEPLRASRKSTGQYGPWSVGEAYGLDIRIEERDGTAWMSVSGELDLATAPLVEESLASAQADHEAVVADLEKLTFMDLTGLYIFLDAAKRAQGVGGRFGIVNSQEPVRRVFDATRMSLLLGELAACGTGLSIGPP